MLKSRDPFGSICLIHELGLYNSIFTFIPPDVVVTFSPPLHPSVRSLTSAYLLQTLLHPNLSSSLPPVHPTLLTAVNADPSCTARLFLAASLSPFLGVTYEDRKKKTSLAVTYSLRESLKLGDQHHFLNGVQALFTASELLNNPDLGRFQSKSERVAIGLFCSMPRMYSSLNRDRDATKGQVGSLFKYRFPLDQLALICFSSRTCSLLQSGDK